MIRNSEPLSMAETLEYVKSDGENESEIIGFIKKFNELKAKDAKELRAEIQNLEIIKVKSEHTAKIADILPENSEELNKIFVDVSLDEDETRKILDTIKKYK